MPDPAKQIQGLEGAHAAARPDDVGSFQSLTQRLTALTGALRETYQTSVATPILKVVAKLTEDHALTSDDVALVESFMVGDAEAYTRVENDFQNWIGELARLIKSLSGKTERLQGQMILDAIGEVEDAQRVLGDICNYLEQQERVARYKRTMSKELDGQSRAMLVEILNRQLASADE